MKNTIQMTNLKKTFWEVISAYSIEVPTIQRDYTYGRKSVKSIRVKFISDIYNTLCAVNHNKLHLDFVYGRLEGVENFKMLNRNKQSINTLLESLKSYANNLHIDVNYDTKEKHSESSEIITFIPLDGQQRLTTLFLFHWYIAKKINNELAIKTLSKFTYSTRNSSKEFIKMLMECNVDALNSFSITNSELFFSFWKNDPTVKSMLSVIDEIDNTFIDVDYNQVWHLLTEEKQITFDFFDLDAFDQTDELYVKMNARGKKLSNFENFKAWLLKKYSDKIDLAQWNKKLDIQWHDLFWNANTEITVEIDDVYLQYFKNVFLGDYILSFKNDEIKGKNFDRLTKFSEESPITIFEQKSNVFSRNISSNLQFLESITNNTSVFQSIKVNKSYIKSNLFEFIFRDNENYNWWEATFFYAVYKFTIYNPTKLKENLQDWVRIISNLIFNTAIDSPLRYKEACESIQKIVKNCNEYPIHYFSGIKESEVNFFTSKQIKEEIKKAQLIKDNEDWKNIFIKYENHHYFYGQIGFIIDLNREIEIENFNTNANKLANLFSKNNLKEIHLLNRLFLSYEECFVQRGSNLMFYSNDYGTLRVRNENWRIIFSDYSHILIELLKIETFDEQNLEKVISENLLKEHNLEAIAVLIKYPYLFSYMRKRCLRKYGNSFLLLSTSRIYGYHKELFTYIHHILNKENTEYIYGTNAVDSPKYKDITKNVEYQYSIEYNRVIPLKVN